MSLPTFGISARARARVRRRVVVLAPGLVMLLASLPLPSQTNMGRISGTVRDESGAAIAGATVTVTDVAKNVSRPLTTDQAGAYNAPSLIPGTKTVRAEFKGFKTVDRQNIVLNVGGDLRVDFVLQPGAVTQTITVTETPPMIETTNTTLGGVLSNQTINELPLNGRNFTNLLTLRPGVTIYPGGGGWTQSTNGIRAHDNVYLVDGVNSNDPWMAQSMMNAGAAAGDADNILPIDAIQEFNTAVNPQAEYGWKPGAVVNVGIKSGTNSLHGTAYAYGRTDSFDARDYFAAPAPAPAPPLSLQQFGATVGGPIKKDKLFYFLSYEDQRYTVGNPAHHNLPVTGGLAATDPTFTTVHLQGACLAALAPGGGGVAPLSAQIAGLNPTNCAPLSNYPGLFVVNNTGSPSVNTSINSQNQIDSGLAKIDYHLNDKNILTGSYFISPGKGLLVDDTSNMVATQWLTDQYARAQVGAVNWTWTPSSAWVNVARVGYSHYYQSFLSNDSTDNPADYTYNGSTYNMYTGQTNPLYFGLPRLRIRSFSGFQLGASWPKIVGPDGVLQLLDQVSTLRGKHAVKFGVEILSMQNDSNVTANAKGPIRFADLAHFFNGIPNQAAFLSGNLQRHLSTAGFAGFIQDDWRMTPRVTVNLGLRYELNTVMKERNDLLGNFDPNSATGLVQVGSGLSSAFNGNHKNFSPRLGVSWDVSGNGRTVVRAGGSLMYEQLSNDVFNNIANVLGLRSVPTGVPLYKNGQQIQGTGTINASTITYTGDALNGTTVPGQVAFDWINNGPNQPLYSIQPACGDGSVTLPTGFAPGPCTIAAVDRNIHTPYIATWMASIQHAITNNLSVELAYLGNRGVKLIGLNDINLAPVGSGWTPAAKAACLNPNDPSGLYGDCSPDNAAEQLARPFNAKFPYLEYIDLFSNADYSNYNSLQATLTQRTSHGLSFVIGYTYAHSLDIASDNWGTQHIPIQPNNNLLYGSSDTDIRHRGTISLTYDLPSKNGYGQLLKGWSLNSIVTLQSGLPWWAQDTTNDFTGTGEVNQNADPQYEQWDFFGKASDFQMIHGFTNYNGGATSGGTGGVPYFPGGNSVAAPTTNAACNAAAKQLDGGAAVGLAQAALFNTGCYALGNSILVPPAFGTLGTTGRNIWRDTGFKNWDLSVTKSFRFKERLTAQFRVEFFNVLNHPTFANPYGGQGGGAASNDPSIGAGFACGCVTADTGGSNPVLGSGGPRAMQLGMKLIW
jgi:Carboxypeptidase regulatory-like domain